MPLNLGTSTSVGGKILGNPWRGLIEHQHQYRVNIADLTTGEVDADGYIKPGVPLSSANPAGRVTAGRVEGCTIESIKVAASNSPAALTAAGVIELTIGTIGQVNRKIIEDNLGRPLTAAEIAGFTAPGCLVKLLA